MVSRIATAVTVAIAAILTLNSAAVAQDDGAAATLESSLKGADFGERVVVTGTNWPENSLVQVQICGNLALNGSVDCDSVTAVQAGVSAAGTFGSALTVGNPPTPCPCVFLVTSLTEDVSQTLEFEVRGAAIGDPSADEPPDRRLAVTEARIEGSGPWTAYFGGSPDRTLILTVVNNGFVAVDDPQVVLALGKGEDPTGFVTPPELGRLEPGDSITVETELDMPVLAIGTYAVVGSIPGFDPSVEFRAETSHIPWLLFLVLVLAVLALGFFVGRRSLRRRRMEREAANDAVSPDQASDSLEEDSIEAAPSDNAHATAGPDNGEPSEAEVSTARAGWDRGRIRPAR